jgi:glycosyltransferase involved in cell wall biosynthesis
MPRHPALRAVRVADRDEMRALAFAARAGVVTRRAPGGFPIKLLAYMEAGIPIVAFEHVVDGLRHDVSAVLLDRESGPAAFAEAFRELDRDRERARRIGTVGREHLDRVHDWCDVARATEAFARACALRQGSAG